MSNEEEELLTLKGEILDVFTEKWKECGEIYDDMKGLYTSDNDAPLSIKGTCEISSGNFVLATYAINDGNKSPSNIDDISEFFDFFKDSEEYPANVAERGVPNNTYYTYISTTFLNGYINYVEIVKAFIVKRYGDEWTPENIEKWKTKLDKDFHSDLHDIFDDVFILGKTENCYWFFWSDCDCSDSCIGRFDKGTYTDEQVLELLKKHMQTEFGEYEEIKLSGWKTL